MINEDKNNKVNFGKSGAAPIYNGTAGWIRPEQIALGTLKMTTTGSLN